MVTKNISTEHGDVVSAANISHTDNGQTVIHVISKLGESQHEHRITVGAADGKDVVANMTETDLQTSLQTHLDRIRIDAVNILVGRAKVSKVAVLLS